MEVREGADHLRVVLKHTTAFSQPASRSGCEEALDAASLLLPGGSTGSTPLLTLPVVAPPLPDIVELIEKRTYLVVVRTLMHHREAAQQTVKRDKRELCQVELMDLCEDRLTRTCIHCRLFLLVDGIQGRIAVKTIVSTFGGELST